MKLLMRDEAKGKEHTIFVTIFAALMVMLVIMVMLMASAIGVSGVTLRLDENAVDILDKQVENRARYIEAQLQQAQDLTELSSFINDKARQMLDEGTLSLDTLDSTGGESLPLLEAAAPRLLKALRAKQVSGRLPHPEHPRLYRPHLRRPAALRLSAGPRPGSRPLSGQLRRDVRARSGRAGAGLRHHYGQGVDAWRAVSGWGRGCLLCPALSSCL